MPRGPAPPQRWITDDLGRIELYRRCKDCLAWRPLHGLFTIRKRHPDGGQPIRWDTRCNLCRRVEEHAYRAQQDPEVRREQRRRRYERLKADPDRMAALRARDAERQRRARAANPERHRAAVRRYRRRRSKREVAEDSRMQRRLALERNGKDPRGVRRMKRAPEPNLGRVPVERLLPVLERLAAELGSEQAVAALAGVSDRTLRTWRRSGGQANVVAADRLLTRAGVLWHDVFDE